MNEEDRLHALVGIMIMTQDIKNKNHDVRRLFYARGRLLTVFNRMQRVLLNELKSEYYGE